MTAGVDQLELSIEAPAGSSLPHQLRAMQPTRGGGPFDDPEYFFEPWWPGARALLDLERGRPRMRIEHLADPLERFPELLMLGDHFAGDGLTVDGTLLVLDADGRPDPELLRRRLASGAIPERHAAFVASDLLSRDAQALNGLSFAERRRQLTQVITDGDWCVLARGVPGDGEMLAAAVAPLGVAELSARRLSARYRSGPAGDAWLRLSITSTLVEARRPLLTLLQRLPL